MINIFKSYLSAKSSYKGGKSKTEAAPGKKMYKLSSNENLLGPSPMAVAAIKNHVDSLNEYSDYDGDRFRDALADFYSGQMDEDQFVSANSGVEILDMICRAFLEPGLNSIICNPCFGPYNLFTKKAGADVIDIRLSKEDFDIDVDGILNAINEKTRLVFLANPNNPTGTHIQKKVLDKIIDGLPDHVVLVLDEVYYQFSDSHTYSIALPFVLAGKNVIAVNSFSKAYGLAGLRVGYAYSTSKLANYLRETRRPFMLSTLTQEGAMAALKDTEHIQKVVKLVQSEKEKYYVRLSSLGLKYWKTQANFILVQPKMDETVFTELMLAEGIMVRPMSGFGAPGCVRITIGTEEANDACLAALERIL